MQYATPAFEPPYRVLLLAASTDGWYQAPAVEREQALDSLSGLLGRAQAQGARLIGSFDDDVFATGQPLSLPYSIYVLYEVDDLNVIVRLVHELRVSPLGRMLRLEARVGRPLFLLAN
jgi:chlorite dismutase